MYIYIYVYIYMYIYIYINKICMYPHGIPSMAIFIHQPCVFFLRGESTSTGTVVTFGAAISACHWVKRLGKWHGL